MAETTTRSLRLKATYEDTDFTRDYIFTDFPQSVIPDIKDKVNAINASIAAGTDSGMADFFTSNNGDRLAKITEAVLTRTTETPLDLGGE